MTTGRYRLSTDELVITLRRLRNFSLLVMALSAFIIVYYLISSLQENSGRYIPLMVGYGFLWLAAVAAAIHAWQGRYRGIWEMATVGLVLFGVTSFIFSDMGIWYGICAIMFPLAIAAQIPAGKVPRWVFIAGFVAGVITLFIDLYWPLDRPITVREAQVWPYVPLILLVSAFVVASFRDFLSRSIRIKLIVSFVVVSLGSVVPAIAYLNNSTRNIIQTRQYEKLETVASQTALELDILIENTRKMVENEAQLSDFRQYLEKPPSERAGSNEELRVLEDLNSLADRSDQNILSYALIDQDGDTLMSSTGLIGTNQIGNDYFQTALNGASVASDVMWEADGPVVYFAAPVRSSTSAPLGVLRLTYNARVIQDIVRENNGLAGIGSYGIVIDNYHIRLAVGNDTGQLYKLIVQPYLDRVTFLKMQRRLPDLPVDQLTTNFPDFEDYLNKIEGRPNATVRFEERDESGTNVSFEYIAAKKMTQHSWWVMFAQDEIYALSPLKNQKLVVSWLLLGISGLIGVASLGLSWFLSQPINRLTQAAIQLGGGDYSVQIPVKNEDEFGLLSQTFNTMAGHVRQSITDLETRVSERTHDIERRAAQIQVALEVSKAVSSVRALELLLPQIAMVVSERFGFYHIGIFLLDERGEYAELRAASSPGGQRMLARQHSLKVGGSGIVGYVTATGMPRIAMNVGQDSVFYDNPDLPNTRSEMALPLMVAGRVLGALDIQSTEENAFVESDIAILQVVADQIAAAIENSRLFADLQAAVDATQRAYGDVSKQAWTEFLHARPNQGYLVGLSDRPVPTRQELSLDIRNSLGDLRAGKLARLDAHTILVPIKIRGLVAGVIRLEKSDLERGWSVDEVNLVETLMEQMSTALENARLYNETQRNAARDRLVGDITDKMRRAVDMETLLKTTVQEISSALGVPEAFVQLSPVVQLEGTSGNGNGDQP